MPTSANPQPPSQQAGPYRLTAELGRGAGGVVYRAEHDSTGAVVALKTVHVGSEQQLAAMRREVHTLSRLHHPGIVRIVDHGIEGECPWYAMELVDGPGLLERLPDHGVSSARGAPTQPLPSYPRSSDGRPQSDVQPRALSRRGTEESNQARRIAQERLRRIATLGRRLCAPLSYLHGEGVVHRDLTPANVRLRPDGVPVIVDFGLASSLGTARLRDILEDSGPQMGTVVYMAPEQIAGELVDARADLYALGCILYELLTLRPPFVCNTVHALMDAHTQQAPLPPSHWVQGLPEGFDALILRLLAKRPEDRYGYASDVSAALAELGGATVVDEAAGPAARDYLYRPRLMGRASLLGACDSVIRELSEGQHSRTLLLTGHSGIGKTRLALETAGLAQSASVRVLTGACEPAAGADALHPLRAALVQLAECCRAGGPDTVQRLLGSDARLLSAYAPQLAAAAAPPAHEAPVDSPGAVVEALRNTLSRWAREQPILLMLDDLQWADASTLALVRRLAEDLPPRLGMVATCRETEASPALLALAERKDVLHLRPEPLSRADVLRMVADMLARTTPPAGLVDRIHADAQGNPFMVVELMHSALAEHTLFRTADGRWTSELQGDEEDSERGTQPPSPDVSRRRIESQDPATRLVLDRACVLDRGFTLAQLVAMAGDTALDTLDAVDRLLRDGLFREPAPGLLGFRHDRTRETAYTLLEASKCRQLHLSAAETLQALRPSEPGALRQVAYHYERGDAPERAAEFRIQAGQAASSAGANHDALGDFEAADLALKDCRGGKLSCQLDLARGRVLADMGRLDEARTHFERALQHCALGDAAARAHVQLGYLAYRQGRAEAMLDHARQAQTQSRTSRDLRLVVEVENVLGIAHGARGYCRQAIEHYQRAAKVADGLGDTTSGAMRRSNISINQRMLGELDAAEATLQQALELLGDDHPGMRANVLVNLARVHLDRQDAVEAQAVLERAIQLADRTATYGILDEALFCLGQAALLQGQLPEANARARQAIDRATQTNQNVQLGCAHRLLAQAQAAADVADPEAKRGFARSVEILRTTGDREELAHSLLARARHLRALGEPADELDAQARTLFEELDMRWRLEAP